VDHAGKIALLQSLHVLCVPTVYPEAKGFYVLEALAAGAAVVAPRHGSFPELIGATGGGVCYDPDDREAATEVIARWMDDRAERDRLAAAGRASVAREFTADAMADRTWAIYEALLERAPAGGAGG
jgi:glycosyltransferase involved in cell wall biosynthesis